MSSRDRRHLFLPVLCALLALGYLAPHDASGDTPPDPGAEVARLYEQASDATQRYEAGLRASRAQRREAQRLERRLAEERRVLATYRADLGRIASAQYRAGAGLPYTARLLLADDPEGLLRSQHAANQADLAVTNAIGRTQRAERRLAEGERTAAKVSRTLARRADELGRLKTRIETQLRDAQQRLERQAETSVTAGKCPGAVRLGNAGSPARTGRPWMTPVRSYTLSAGYGGQGDRWANRHSGQDFAVDTGTPVRAIGAGRVIRVGCGGAYGIEVVVRHDGGYYSQYAHLSAPAVDQGDRIQAGDWIGQSGSTGNSTGPHLHFEIRLTPYYGSAVDPGPWFAERGVVL
ncbi:murein hydrolase activator EnvC family protein [Streptomyces albidoflavus]